MKSQDVFQWHQEEFASNLDNSFDIAHFNALQLMTVKDDKLQKIGESNMFPR